MSLEKRDAGAMKITLEDMVKASGNNATDLWELVEKHSPSNPDFALQVAKKILYGPNIFIRKLQSWAQTGLRAECRVFTS
jgi:hypothetical protein